MPLDSSFLTTLLSASALPLLAVLGILLRRNLFQGKAKIVVLTAGLALLLYTVAVTFFEHGENLGFSDMFVAGITVTFTFFILSKFNHGHTHGMKEGGAKGLVISEAFHSLIDGAVIGATYLINPVLGGAATLGIIIHEFPKIIGTLALLRGIGLSVRRTIAYGFVAQVGSPVAALFIYMLGRQFDEEKFHALEIASVSSLGAIIIWIIWLEVKYHKEHRHAHGEQVTP
jgi:hypothetical protein